jgi:hypothetical protein
MGHRSLSNINNLRGDTQGAGDGWATKKRHKPLIIKNNFTGGPKNCDFPLRTGGQYDAHTYEHEDMVGSYTRGVRYEKAWDFGPFIHSFLKKLLLLLWLEDLMLPILRPKTWPGEWAFGPPLNQCAQIA